MQIVTFHYENELRALPGGPKTLSLKALVTTAVPAASRTVAGVGLAGSYDDAKRHSGRAIAANSRSLIMRFADSAGARATCTVRFFLAQMLVEIVQMRSG